MTWIAVHSAITERSVGCRTTNATPSLMSARMCVCSARRSGRSGRRMNTSDTADTRNVRASMAIVGPGPIAPASSPASAGPTIQPMLNTASKMALARGTWPRPTSPGTAAV